MVVVVMMIIMTITTMLKRVCIYINIYIIVSV